MNRLRWSSFFFESLPTGEFFFIIYLCGGAGVLEQSSLGGLHCLLFRIPATT